jgi:Uma2 family endonuclease
MNAPKMVIHQDGLPRRLFRIADFDRMVEIGVIGHDERIELIGGELIPMAAKGIQHEVLKQSLTLHFADTRPPGITFIQEGGWRIDDLTYVEPDYVFHRAEKRFDGLSPLDALLVVEVAASSLSYDLGRKAQLYAEFGVPEYWVIDAVRRETFVHSERAMNGYASMRSYAADEEIIALAVPGLKLRLADLA